MYYYKVAGIKISTENAGSYVNVPAWRMFLSPKPDKADISAEICIQKEADYLLEKFEVDPVPEGRMHCIRYKEEVFFANADWTKAWILPSRNTNAFYMFMNQLFYSAGVKQKMLQIHSSLIEYHGHGLMFLGPSGIGKTTQAELWNQYRGALIINGDVVFVQETEDSFLGWGTPWHGSSPYCENTNVPVRAMVVLKQAPDNSIRELTGFEKVTAVSNSVFYPRWLENGMELCLETLDHLLSSVPVYELSCRPDEDAVRLVEDTVFNGSF